MRGHISKKKGKAGTLYYTVIADGKRRKWQKVESTRDGKPVTLKDAQTALIKRLAAHQNGTSEAIREIRYRAFVDLWKTQYAEAGEIRASTLATYAGFFKNHLIPAFGHKNLDRITVEDIQSFKAKKLRQGLAPQTVKHLMRVLKQMLEHACDWGYLSRNPADKVRYPKIPKREMDFLTADDIRELLAHTPDRWYGAMIVAATTGLRLGELIAMRWKNVDWTRCQYFVRETWLRSRGGQPATFGRPKTDSSIAPVDLSPQCLAALRRQRQQQAKEKLKAGADYVDQDLVFATAFGSPLDDSHFTKRVYLPALDAAGLRKIRFHSLRHSVAALLIANNESAKYVQKQMRHASIQVTFDRYGHLYEDTNRRAAERVDQRLFEKGKEAVEMT